jgi:hypothetical protein
MMEHPEKAAEMGMNGFRYAREHLHRTALAKKYLQRLGELI